MACWSRSSESIIHEWLALKDCHSFSISLPSHQAFLSHSSICSCRLATCQRPCSCFQGRWVSSSCTAISDPFVDKPILSNKTRLECSCRLLLNFHTISQLSCMLVNMLEVCMGSAQFNWFLSKLLLSMAWGWLHMRAWNSVFHSGKSTLLLLWLPFSVVIPFLCAWFCN